MKTIVEIKNEKQFHDVLKNVSEATGIDVPLRDMASWQRQLSEAFEMVECICRPVPLMNQMTNEPFTEEELIHACSRQIMGLFRKHIRRFARRLPDGCVIYVQQCHLIITDEDGEDYELLARGGRSG